MKRFRLDGWTITYFVLAGLFCIGLTTPGIMAAIFWVSIGVLNEVFARQL
jgi:hypothetical protein